MLTLQDHVAQEVLPLPPPSQLGPSHMLALLSSFSRTLGTQWLEEAQRGTPA